MQPNATCVNTMLRACAHLSVQPEIGKEYYSMLLPIRLKRLRRTINVTYLNEASVSIPGLASGDSLGYNLRSGVFPNVDHLGACVCLLGIVCESNRIELSY